MGTVEADVQKRVDEYVEIPGFFADGQFAGEADAAGGLQLREGTGADRVALTHRGLTFEVESVGLERALRLVEQER